MYMKRFLLINSLAFALLGASAVSAQAGTVNQPMHQHKQCGAHFGAMLSPEQRAELQQIRSTVRAQMIPLIKEKRALRLQIMGKVATPNTSWNEIASLVEKSNANNAKIALLAAKTRFEIFQKFGIVLPNHHQRHHFKPVALK